MTGITYFTEYLPKIKDDLAQQGLEHLLHECVQEAGEIMFVPPGWWHAVINLTDTIAISQNYVSENNFLAAWRKVRRSRRWLSKRWLDRLTRSHPDLAYEARMDNLKYNFDYSFTNRALTVSEQDEEEVMISKENGSSENDSDS